MAQEILSSTSLSLRFLLLPLKRRSWILCGDSKITGWFGLYLLPMRSSLQPCVFSVSLWSVCLAENYCFLFHQVTLGRQCCINTCLWICFSMCTYVEVKLILLTIFVLFCLESGMDYSQRAIASSLLKGPAPQHCSTEDPASQLRNLGDAFKPWHNINRQLKIKEKLKSWLYVTSL